MVVGFSTTYAISANHNQHCEFESHSGEVYSIQHYVIKFVSDLWQIGDFLWVLAVCSTNKPGRHVKSCVKHRNSNPQYKMCLQCSLIIYFPSSYKYMFCHSYAKVVFLFPYVSCYINKQELSFFSRTLVVIWIIFLCDASTFTAAKYISCRK